ncbi:MAG: hypothetical protein LBH49_02520 [Puniceicoccales bacterium]|jgi:hypothetical protein|nr:hypothetical protein [Puniceicoccales bacterium]
MPLGITPEISGNLIAFIATNHLRYILNKYNKITFEFSANANPFCESIPIAQTTLRISLPFYDNCNNKHYLYLEPYKDYNQFSFNYASHNFDVCSSILHEFGHAWHNALGINTCYIYPFDEFRKWQFLRELFPICDTNIPLPGNYIRDFVTILQQEQNKLRTFSFAGNLQTHIDFPKQLACLTFLPVYNSSHYKTIDIFSKKLNNAITHNDTIEVARYVLFNNMHCNSEEIFQVLGLSAIKDTLYINRLSDFNYNGMKVMPIRYYYNMLTPGKLENLSSEKRIIENAALDYTRTVKPTSDAIQTLFWLHGKDVISYMNNYICMKSRNEPQGNQFGQVNCIPAQFPQQNTFGPQGNRFGQVNCIPAQFPQQNTFGPQVNR